MEHSSPLEESKLTSTQNQTIAIKHWRHPDPLGQVLMLHGIESHGAWFDKIATELVAKGFDCWAYDRSGNGASTGPRGHCPSSDFFNQELSKVIAHIRSAKKPFVLLGMSWGGMGALHYTMKNNPEIDQLVLVAPGIYPAQRPSIKEALEIFGNRSDSENQCYKLPYQSHQFSPKPENIAFVDNDTLRVQSVTGATCLTSARMQRTIDRKFEKASLPPIQVFLAKGDEIINNSKTKKLFSKSSNQTVEINEYECGHSMVLDIPQELASRITELLA
jgi:lysophospholipase